MTGGYHGNAGSEVEEAVSIGILDNSALASFGYQGIGTSVGRGNDAVVPVDNGLGLGAGQRGDQLRQTDMTHNKLLGNQSLRKGRSEGRSPGVLV